MGIPRDLYGSVRTVPVLEDEGWGDNVTSYDLDLITGVEFTTSKKGSLALQCLPPKTPATYLTGETITPTHPEHVISGNGGPVTLSGVTAIADGSKNGEILVLKGAHATNTVTILDAANTALNGPVVLGLNDKISLKWDGSDWVEQWRNS